VALETTVVAPSGGPALREIEERSPYPGLSAFTEKDASFFFGREREVEELWARIRTRKLLALIGPSGAGKTSFLRAGVLPARPEGWSAVVSTPGGAPSRHLAQALARELAGNPDAVARLLGFEDPDIAVEVVSRWRRERGEALVVLDQFEELITLNPLEVQERFAVLLGRLVAEADVHVLLSLRDDFLIRCCEHTALTPVLRELTALLALKPEDLRRAIEEPARRRGYRFEDEALVTEMVQSVEGARAALPLLAFAVSRLWEKRDPEKKVLTRAAHEAMGGVAGALAQHAEQTMERIGSERHELVREIFRNLTTAQGTRAVMDREELLSAFPDRDAAEAVVAHLVDARLLTSYEVEGGEGEPSRHRIEIVHESLLKAWPRLVRWQTQDEDGAQLRDQLKQAAHLWEERGHTPDVLWSGSALKEYELWRERYGGSLTALEESFAGAMVERESRRRRWRRIAVASVVVVSLAVAAVVGISRQQAVRHAERADREARRAEASKLVALAELRLEEDPTEALALATASLELADTQEARQFAVRALAEGPPAREAATQTNVARIPQFSPDGRWLVATGHADTAVAWSRAGEGPVLLPGHEATTQGPLRSGWPDERHLLTGPPLGLGGTIHVWAWPSGEGVRSFEVSEGSRWAAGRGGWLLTATPEAEDDTGRQTLLLRRWSLPHGDAQVLGRVTFPIASDERVRLVTTTTFEPHGRGWIYASGPGVYLQAPGVPGQSRLLGRFEATVDELAVWRDKLLARDTAGDWRIWSFPPDGPRVDHVIPRPQNAPAGVTPELSGRWLFDLEDRQARLWDLTTLPGARPLQLRRSGTWALTWMDFDPSGDWVVATTRQMSRLTFWPLARSLPTVIDGYAGGRQSLAFSADSRWVAAASWPAPEHGIRLWPVPGSGREARSLSDDGAVDLAWDPQGRYLVRYPGGVRLIPLDGSPSRPLPNPTDTGSVNLRMAVSPSGRRVATAFFFGTGQRNLRVWDLETDELRLFPLPPTASPDIDPSSRGAVSDLHFTSESTLYTAGDGGLRRWDLETGSHEVVWAPAPEEHLGMAMSADGRVALTGISYITAGCHPAGLLDLRTGEHRGLPEYGVCVTSWGIDPSGRVIATGDQDGMVRVGRVEGGAPHLLYGHKGPVSDVEISPDGRWVASISDDETLRFWPMPDLDRPPLHMLPYDELLVKLRSLTNLRAVRDPESSTGWTIALGPFPGWKEVPEW
jgi:WD40 repeat protein